MALGWIEALLTENNYKYNFLQLNMNMWVKW